MKHIIIDTCIFIHIVRETSTGDNCLQELERFDDAPNIIASMVNKAALQSFIAQNNWGQPKTHKLNQILDTITFIDINHSDLLLLQSYTEIDAFSKRKQQIKMAIS